MENQGLILLNAYALIVLIILNIIFFSKKRLHKVEDNTYARLLIVSLITIFLGLLLGIILDLEFFMKIFIILLLNKFYLIGLVIMIATFTFYTYAISHNTENSIKVGKRVYKFFCSINFFVILLLPLNINEVNSEIITSGLAMNYTYLIYSFMYVLLTILIISDFKNIRNKKYIPIIMLVVQGALMVLIQMFFPSLNYIINPSTVITCLIMYFTIENPDIKMIGELQVAREQADKANQAKTDFLSSMSHEIRTPLNAIVGFSECINESDSLNEAKDNAHDIINASKTLLEIVNGILDISKIEAGKLEIVNSPYNAKELFEDLAKLIKPRMDEKALDFTYHIAPDLPTTLYGDHANLKKIVTNLLSNASKYTEKGFVKYEVNCVRSSDTCKLIISVEDSGRGIKKENVDKLFTKFQRLDEDKNTTIEGTGLGLAITKQLIELMGGQIIVHTVYGEGSKFTVVLNQRIENVVQKIETVQTKTTLDLHDKKILLVDDNTLNLKVATKLLERYNANNIECVESGFECLDRITHGSIYDVILLDDMMPKMSGVETLHKLKEIPNFNIPVIALTANAITGMREKYLADGFDDYLAKPIEKDQLIRVLNEIFDNYVMQETNTTETEQPVVSNINHEVIPVGELTEEELENTQKLTPIKDEEIELLEEEPTITNNNYDEVYLRNNGIDMDNALSLLGDMEMYNDTLKDYLSEVDNKFNELIGYKEANDMKNYSILVHSMKSDSKYLGFMKFADIAYQHELKSKENDITFVNENFDKLESELTKVLKIVKEYAEHI